MRQKAKQALNKIRQILTQGQLLDGATEQAIALLEKKVGQLPTEAKVSPVLMAPAELAQHAQGVAMFSDGGCRGNPGPGAWACMAQNAQGTLLFEAGGVDRPTTNNRMEIQGVLESLKHFHQWQMDNPLTVAKPVYLYTDSRYVVDGITQWVPGWKARGWRKADNKAPENLELWQELDQWAAQLSQVEFRWLKGHAGHPQNEWCDQHVNKLMDEDELS